MKVWISKYALSEGIIEAEAAKCVGKLADTNYLHVRGHCHLLMLGRDAYESLAEAQAAAETKRVKKIASLEKQIAKLKAMKF